MFVPCEKGEVGRSSGEIANSLW